MPRKPHAPTDDGRRMVGQLIARGMPRATIAQIIGVSAKTLEKHYHPELATGADKATAAVAGRLFSQCMGAKDHMASTVARIFWMKTHGWRESQVISHEGKDGSPIGGVKNTVHLYRLELPDNRRDPEITAKYFRTPAPPLAIEAKAAETRP